jgi:hypothetical protein
MEEFREKKGGGVWKWLGFGCLGLLVLFGVGTCWVIQNARSIGAEVMEHTADAALDDMNLPETEELDARETIEELTEAFKVGEIDGEVLMDFFSGLGENPVLTIGIGVQAISTDALEKSGLPTEEKLEASRVCQRFLRGLDEGSITFSEAESVFDSLDDQGPRVVFKKRLSDRDLRQLIEGMRAEVEAEGIPDEPFHLNFADELRQEVDEVLGR